MQHQQMPRQQHVQHHAHQMPQQQMQHVQQMQHQRYAVMPSSSGSTNIAMAMQHAASPVHVHRAIVPGTTATATAANAHVNARTAASSPSAPPAASTSSAVPSASPSDTEYSNQIQRYLMENQKLIQAIYENQQVGKLAEAFKYQKTLQTNLMFLASLADHRLNADFPSSSQAATNSSRTHSK